MPYRELADLPPSVKTSLPPHAQEIYLAAFNNAWKEIKIHINEQKMFREKKQHIRSRGQL